MERNLCTRKQAYKIMKSGTFYYPAYMHYKDTPVNVVCDFCNKSNLTCSVGFRDSDLCLECVEMIADNNIQNEPGTLTKLVYKPDIACKTNMMQDSAIAITQMKQSSVRKIKSEQFPLTYMKQDSARPVKKDICEIINDDNDMTFMMQDSVRLKREPIDYFKIRPYNS